MRSELWIALSAALVLGACAGALLAGALRRFGERRRARGYNTRGQDAERAAERLLEAHGYRILGRKLATRYRVHVDGSRHEVQLVLDYLVERGGEQLAAEVKSGPSAPRLEHRETRRQLLEYQLALGARAVLLVDPERERIRRVEFPLSHALRRNRRVPLAAAGTILALSAAALWSVLTRH